MAKNVSMTRERKIALPIILEAARSVLDLRAPFTEKQMAALRHALGAYHGC